MGVLPDVRRRGLRGQVQLPGDRGVVQEMCIRDRDMAFAANYIVENHGGIVVVKDGKVLSSVVLEIAGIMSDEPLTKMNEELEAAKDAAFCLGVSRGIDPFMTLSFMALPVIPTLRITTRGVIDVNTQQYI